MPNTINHPDNKRTFMQVYNKTKTLNNIKRHVIFTTPTILFLDKYDPKPKKTNNLELTPQQLLESQKVTKRIVRDIALCNNFEYFVTLTFKKDRYDYFKKTQQLNDWCKNLRKNHKEFKYLFIPEKHKDGAIHIHGLLSNFPEQYLTPANTKRKNTYNINRWRFGYSTAVKIKQQEPDFSKVANYITKYITKELVHLKNHRKLFTSKNLNRPKIEYNTEVPVDSFTTYQNNDIIIKQSIT
jgi:hypothetical protein